MSVNTAAVLRGITNADMKQVVRRALSMGFVMGEMTGTTHCHLIWPNTGEKVGFGTTVSDRNAWKGFARQLETVSGLHILPEHKHGKAAHKSHVAFSATYTPDSQVEWSERIADRISEYQALVLEFRIITMAEADRKDINRAFVIIRRLAAIETFLKELHQPVPEHDLPLPSQLTKEFEHAS